VLFIPKAENAVPSPREIERDASQAIRVAAVVGTFDFHYQLGLQENAVRDEVTHRVLAPEFYSHSVVVARVRS
jgi:hypothetical protein